jgi:hypothetical protein
MTVVWQGQGGCFEGMCFGATYSCLPTPRRLWVSEKKKLLRTRPDPAIALTTIAGMNASHRGHDYLSTLAKRDLLCDLDRANRQATHLPVQQTRGHPPVEPKEDCDKYVAARQQEWITAGECNRT